MVGTEVLTNVNTSRENYHEDEKIVCYVANFLSSLQNFASTVVALV